MSKKFEHLDYEEKILQQVRKDTKATEKDIQKHRKEISKLSRKVKASKSGQGDVILAPPFFFSQKQVALNRLKKAELRLAQAKLELKILRRQTKALKHKDIQALVKKKHSLSYKPERFFLKQANHGFKLERTPKSILKFAGIKSRRVK